MCERQMMDGCSRLWTRRRASSKSRPERQGDRAPHMCGIAGIVDLSGGGLVPSGALRRMANAMVHRGPDDEGYFERHGVGLANRRLSIVGLADGHQPIGNEDGSVVTVFN